MGQEPEAGVQDWSDAAAVALAADLRRLVVRAGDLDLTALRHLDTATARLEEALRAEQEREHEAQSTARDARAAQEHLQRQAQPRLEEAPGALVRARVSALVSVWSDPYARDITGAPHLQQMRAVLAEALAPLPDLLDAVDAMEHLGQLHDRATARRVQAISARVQARAAWNAAAAVVLSTVPAESFSSWMRTTTPGPQAPFPEADWFSAGEE